MYKRIMVAVDESFMTSQVMEAAVELARSTGAQLAICHAIDETILAQREVAMMLPNSVGKTEARSASRSRSRSRRSFGSKVVGLWPAHSSSAASASGCVEQAVAVGGQDLAVFGNRAFRSPPSWSPGAPAPGRA
jgi:nucleotide-binding universal stress UspA family protein